MGIQGSNLSDKNARLRFLLVIFAGIIVFGVILYWRQSVLTSAEYVQVDVPKQKNQLQQGSIRSHNYQLEIEDMSPSVK